MGLERLSIAARRKRLGPVVHVDVNWVGKDGGGCSTPPAKRFWGPALTNRAIVGEGVPIRIGVDCG